MFGILEQRSSPKLSQLRHYEIRAKLELRRCVYVQTTRSIVFQYRPIFLAASSIPFFLCAMLNRILDRSLLFSISSRSKFSILLCILFFFFPPPFLYLRLEYFLYSVEYLLFRACTKLERRATGFHLDVLNINRHARNFSSPSSYVTSLRYSLSLNFSIWQFLQLMFLKRKKELFDNLLS